MLPRFRCHSHGRFDHIERLGEVGTQIVHIFTTDGQSHQAGRDTLLVRHRRRMLDQRLDTAERYRQRDHANVVHEHPPGLDATPKLTARLSRKGADDAAKAILTTDSKPKQALVRGSNFTVGVDVVRLAG